ncbi:unnamed protein product [Ceutorhynchus assimilis]|uniref:RING-type domain-containing protein n=1 Tax=Ceutorhynchus assimilis TaxID=467358 RepID=A0A9N9MTQ9_9CUCU|nr:unnamed protein product [Ceutorhynchus assimilis]
MSGESQELDDSLDDSQFPSIDFDDFKCSQCEKYLSVAPIYIYTDPIGKNKNVCGRCSVPDEGSKIRNVSYEILAKFLKFPCSSSKNCKEKLAWGEAEDHEAKCWHREMVCEICSGPYTTTTLISHYKKHHQKELFLDKNVVISEGDIYNHTYPKVVLVACARMVCLVHIQVETTIKIKVQPVFATSIPHALTVTFSTRNQIISFKNRQIKQNPNNTKNWNEYDFNIDHILDIFKSDSSEFKMELEIYQDGPNNDENASYNVDQYLSNEASGVMERISNTLECPTCYEVMAGNIYLCKTGHSICESCRKLVPVCPTCQGQYMGGRNYALEEISKKLKDFL